MSTAGSGLVGPPSQARARARARGAGRASPALPCASEARPMTAITSDWRLVWTVLGIVFLAQLPGKSALTALVLSSRHRLLPVLLGAALALAAHSVIAV